MRTFHIWIRAFQHSRIAGEKRPEPENVICSINHVTVGALLSDLKACTMVRDLHHGRKIHAKAVQSQNDKKLFVVTALINMYSKCGSMGNARDLFESIQKPDLVAWTTLLLGYADNGDGLLALEIFSRMKAGGFEPDSVSYIAVLKACTSLATNGDKESLARGRTIHSQICCTLDLYLQNTLIDMYAKCGSMPDARLVFESIQSPNVVSWTVMVLGYADNEDGLVGLEMFSRMKARGFVPNSVTYLAALKACTSLAVHGDGNGKEDCLKRGREIHLQIGCHMNQKMQNTLIDMYAKSGSMREARYVFDSIQNPNVVSWNALLLGYADNGEALVALEMFSWIKARGCVPNCGTYSAILKACSLVGALALGRKFHQDISEIDAYLVTCLVDFYAKCGSMVEARRVFDSYSKKRDASTWTALLSGYGSLGDSDSVFNLFDAMQDEGFKPDSVTFVCLLLCCSHTGLIKRAKGYFEAMFLQYRVTPSVMHYTCMVDIMGRANQLSDAIAIIRKMPCNPNAVTWGTLLGACRKWKNVVIGKWAFQSLVDMDKTDSSVYVVMAQLYGSVGMWEEQERVLEMKTRVGFSKLAGQAYVINDMVKFQH